ncbi:MAG: PQQ-dependent sugar dehydrogenase [Campylobacterota bacterium]
MRVLFIVLFVANFAFAQYGVKQLLDTQEIIWGFDFVDEQTIILTQKNGTISLFDKTDGSLQEVSGFDADIFHRGQGGLLDVALSPSFAQDKRVYFTYSKAKKSQGATALAYATLEGTTLMNFNEIIVTNSLSSSGIHFGSRIAFDSKGMLYFSIGDRGDRDKAQQKTNHNGTILQVDPRTFEHKVHSYGHRNVQGLFYDNDAQILYASEHGPRGGDEINSIKKGANYGWPVVSLGKEYTSNRAVGVKQKEGMQDPIFHYTPSIAPSSLIIYKGDVFKKFRGKFISTALAKRLVSIVDKKGNEIRILQDKKERFRNVKEDSKGQLYLSTDSGKLYQLLQR